MYFLEKQERKQLQENRIDGNLITTTAVYNYSRLFKTEKKTEKLHTNNFEKR